MKLSGTLNVPASFITAGVTWNPDLESFRVKEPAVVPRILPAHLGSNAVRARHRLDLSQQSLALVTCEVEVTNVLDLRDPSNREKVGLSILDMTSDVGDYEPCHRVGQAAHQLELHGILAPAATGVGETLALFERRLPAEEQPALIGFTTWDGLPTDPRSQRSRFGTTQDGASEETAGSPGDEARD